MHYINDIVPEDIQWVHNPARSSDREDCYEAYDRDNNPLHDGNGAAVIEWRMNPNYHAGAVPPAQVPSPDPNVVPLPIDDQHADDGWLHDLLADNERVYADDMSEVVLSDRALAAIYGATGGVIGAVVATIIMHTI